MTTKNLFGLVFVSSFDPVIALGNLAINSLKLCCRDTKSCLRGSFLKKSTIIRNFISYACSVANPNANL